MPQCVCDPGWAHRLSLGKEDTATHCAISLLSLRIECAVFLTLNVVIAVLTARSVRLGKLDQARGLACLLGLGLMFAFAAAALARGGPETSVSGWAMRQLVSDAATYCFCFLTSVVGVDKYAKAVKQSAANIERKGDDSGRRPVLERDTIKTIGAACFDLGGAGDVPAGGLVKCGLAMPLQSGVHRRHHSGFSSVRSFNPTSRHGPRAGAALGVPVVLALVRARPLDGPARGKLRDVALGRRGGAPRARR